MKNAVDLLFEKTAQYQLLSSEQEKQLIKRVQQNNDEEAKELLYYCNIRLVVSVAKKFVSNDMPLEDLIMEGCKGIAKAIEKFDVSTENKFSTYAVYWIEQVIRYNLLQHQPNAKVSIRTQKAINKIKVSMCQYEVEYEKKPTNEDLAKLTGFSLKKVGQLLNLIDTNKVISYNTLFGESDTLELLNLIECPNSKSAETIEREVAIQMAIENCFSVLTEKEKKIIILRYGLYGNKPHTMEELSSYYGITRQGIYSIVNIALRKIREKYKCNDIKLQPDDDYETVRLERLCKKIH